MKLQGLPGSGCNGAVRTARVLIADDDTDCLWALEKAFGLQGLECIACRDGKAAWSAICRNPRVSLVVLNWMMPLMDGLDICRLLRKTRPHVATALMIGQDFLRDAWSVLEDKPRYVITKPLPKSGIDLSISRIVADAFRR